MSQRISVASICRGLPGPADPSGGIFVLRRLQAMARQAQVEVLQPIPWFPVVAPLRQWARKPYHHAQGLQIEHAPMFYLPKYAKSLDGYWLYRAIYARLAALKAVRRLDIVDAHFAYPEGVGAFWAARRIGVPVVVTLRGFEAEYIHRPAIGRQIRHVIRRADGCICVSQFLQDLAIEHGAHPSRTRVIHNAIDRKQFYPGTQAEARRRLGLPQDVPIIISVGHLTFRKRHHVLIDAFGKLKSTHPEARLLILGASTFELDYPEQLKQRADRLGLAGAVHLLGNVDADSVADYLRAADVFALGTQREGCCNAVLEALACGLPVVTTPVGDNDWFVRNGENGYLVPVDDPAAMAQALAMTLQRHDWDRGRISADLGVGDWHAVASDVLAFFAERTEQFSGAARASAGISD